MARSQSMTFAPLSQAGNALDHARKVQSYPIGMAPLMMRCRSCKRHRMVAGGKRNGKLFTCAECRTEATPKE